MPSNYGITASSVAKSSGSTKILLSAFVQTQEVIGDVYGAPTYSSYEVFPNGTYIISFPEPNEIISVQLTATLTSGINENYYLNPVVGQAIYFNIGGSIVGTGSLDSASSSTMITDSEGQISRTFNGEEWMNFFNGDFIIAYFDGNFEGTLSPSQSGVMYIEVSAS